MLHKEANLTQAILENAVPLQEPKSLTPLIDQISQARIVMLGESSHGTHEFYDWRRLISEWLITKHGFNFVAVEGDWPPCFSLNEYIHGESKGNLVETLGHFDRWPTWMWANTDIMRLAE